jgi:hypothetical protein
MGSTSPWGSGTGNPGIMPNPDQDHYLKVGAIGIYAGS